MGVKSIAPSSDLLLPAYGMSAPLSPLLESGLIIDDLGLFKRSISILIEGDLLLAG